MLDLTESSASYAADETESYGVSFGRRGLLAGSEQSRVLGADHVVLNVCDSDYDLAVMDTLLLERLWALGLVPKVPGLG